jgi:hypothetical protein
MVGRFDTEHRPAYVAGAVGKLQRTARRSRLTHLGIFALLSIPTFAFSQDAPTGDEDVEPERKDSERSDSYSLGGIDAANVSTPTKQSNAETMVANQRKILARLTMLLIEARSAKDIVQLNCVNEKLTQIKGLLKISESGSAAMYEAIANNQEDVVNHEYTKITVAHQRCVTLGAEAEQCVGELAVYTGQTEVTVEIDEDVTEKDPTEPTPGDMLPTIPPVASFF